MSMVDIVHVSGQQRDDQYSPQKAYDADNTTCSMSGPIQGGHKMWLGVTFMNIFQVTRMILQIPNSETGMVKIKNMRISGETEKGVASC